MIGVFDSGFGGLTILKAFLGRLPDYDYVYLGDNARAPYGSKSQEVIYSNTREAVDFLFKQGCELVIIACNTASSKALRKIQQEFLTADYPDKRVLGMVIPVAEAAIGLKLPLKKGGWGDCIPRIGVIGTRATIESGTYETELKKLAPKIKVFQKACPLLVPLVEEGWASKPETKTILKKYLAGLKTKNLDTLILGCTHYPFLQEQIQRIMGREVKVLDSPTIVAEKLEDYLKRHPEIESKLEKSGKRIFYTTDDAEKFKSFGEKFIGTKIGKVLKIEL
jgi:glutamate racemase